MNHLLPAKRPNIVVINRKKRPCHLVNSTVPRNQRVKMNESEKITEYLDLVR